MPISKERSTVAVTGLAIFGAAVYADVPVGKYGTWITICKEDNQWNELDRPGGSVVDRCTKTNDRGS